MTMYFVGIDISKYKHDYCIISAASQKVVSMFTIKNDNSSFEQLHLILNSLSTPEYIRIGSASTAHYALNLELFLENANHTFPEFKPFFQKRLSKTALYLLENYGSAEKMARMNSSSYENLRSISRGKFSPQQFIRLKELAANTIDVNNSIFDVELSSLLTLYKSLACEIKTLEHEINRLVDEVYPYYMSIPVIGPISAAIIYAEYCDISNFSSPNQMLAFAGIEPSIHESGTEAYNERMVKHDSSQLRYVLINCCLPLIRFDVTFATYYAKKRS